MARAVVYDVDGTLYPLWPMRFYMLRELAWRLAHSPIRLLREVSVLGRLYDSQYREGTVEGKPSTYLRRRVLCYAMAGED